jgi:hypothetical protein
VPLHIDTPESIPFSHFFDFDPLRQRMGRSILEWTDIKDARQAQAHLETVDCLAISDLGMHPDRLDKFGLRFEWDTSFQPRKIIEGSRVVPLSELLTRETEKPQGDLACYSDMFEIREAVFQNGHHTIPDIGEVTPRLVTIWDKIGAFLPFTDLVVRQRDSVLASLLPSAATEYLAVHFRRTDFLQWHDNPPLAVFAQALSDVARQLPDGLPVLVATDAEEPDLLDFIKEHGWILLDHEALETATKWGPWASTMIDTAILAGAKGFVGTWGSTMSFLAAARVETWHRGPTHLVKGQY